MALRQNYQIMTIATSTDGEYYGVFRVSRAAVVEGYILEYSFHSNIYATKWLYNIILRNQQNQKLRL